MTYLELVNDVMVRLREDEVTAVTDTSYSKLIGKFVNDAKRQVEDAYDWNALSETLTVVTSAELFNYVLTDIGQRFRVIDVLNNTKESLMTLASTEQMNKWLLGVNGATIERDFPKFYNFNGVDENGDTQVDLYPIPDGIYTLYFNVIKPQPLLTAAADILKIPSEPVIFLAYAKALAERGEDQGVTTNEAYVLFKESMSDHIATEANRYPDEITWDWV
jgi:hypothetical protein